MNASSFTNCDVNIFVDEKNMNWQCSWLIMMINLTKVLFLCSICFVLIRESKLPVRTQMKTTHGFEMWSNGVSWGIKTHTARITFIFTSLSAVQICDFHIFLAIYSSLYGFIWNQHDQLPVGLLAQLVERCIGIAEVMGSIPVQAWFFSGLIFHYCSSVQYCEDHFYIHILMNY